MKKLVKIIKFFKRRFSYEKEKKNLFKEISHARKYRMGHAPFIKGGRS